MKSTTFDLLYPLNSGFKKTEIHFYTGKPDLYGVFYKKNGAHTTRRLFVTDTTIAKLPSVKNFISRFKKEKGKKLPKPAYCAVYHDDVLVVLGAGESYKTIDNVLLMEQVALEHNLDRHAVFTAIGGGVICDMTGFAASLFKRGVAVDFVPTTLLAMVDASLGGKTGCDFLGYKNMIGSFSPALHLHIWSSFVQSLPEKEYRSGLAEAVKTALLFSKDLYKLFVEKKDKVLHRDEKAVAEMISVCVQAKARIVHKDFREQGERALLNYGHTFGHAFESAAGLGKVTHGAAVAWGMGRALDVSRSLGLCSASYADSAKSLLSAYGWDMSPLPKEIDSSTSNGKTAKLLLGAMHKDKNNSPSTKIRVILQKGLCRNVIIEVDEADILPVLTK